MSQENVEIVRRSVEALARNDWDTFLAGFDSDVEWVEIASLGPDAAAYTGTEELRDAVQSWTQKWTEYEVEVSRYAQAGDDVIVLSRERGRGTVSGVEVERAPGAVFTLQDGKVVRVRLYGNWSEALEAAGLRE
jgi:ketosteroid isomerase-like protein